MQYPFCAECPLPDIKRRLAESRQAAQTANANISASETPTQAEPFQQQASQALAELKVAMGDYTKFVPRICQSCEIR